eukprot:5390056-Amphidinium_carterae.1
MPRRVCPVNCSHCPTASQHLMSLTALTPPCTSFSFSCCGPCARNMREVATPWEQSDFAIPPWSRYLPLSALAALHLACATL